MARPFPVAVRVATEEATRPATSLEQRLESIALPLKKLAAADVARQFELPAHAQVLKTTLSLCPDCLEHITAAIYVEAGRVLMAKRCARHGAFHAVIENDEAYYRLSTKDRWGRAYDESRLDHVPAYEAGGCCDGGECAP